MRVKEIDGLPVVDAKRPLRLNISTEDIKGASTKDPSNCAIARACRRELHVKEARIHLARTYLRTNEHNWVRYITPSQARSEIIAFDRGGTFQPLEIRLMAVQKSHRAGVPRKRGKPTGKGQKRRKPHVVTDVRGGPA